MKTDGTVELLTKIDANLSESLIFEGSKQTALRYRFNSRCLQVVVAEKDEK
jgi:hypothetical protein